MAKKPPIKPEEEMPPYIKKGGGRGASHLGPNDLVWLGEDGELDPDEALNRHGYDPTPPLSIILSAIIDAHPIEGGDTKEARLEKALKALTGRKRMRGMDTKDDYDILLEVAWDFFVSFIENNGAEPEVKPIIRKHIEQLPENDPRRYMAEIDSVFRRVSRKFAKEKDLLLARVTGDSNYDRMDTISLIKNILAQFEKLGIKVENTAVKSRRRKRDK